MNEDVVVSGESDDTDANSLVESDLDTTPVNGESEITEETVNDEPVEDADLEILKDIEKSISNIYDYHSNYDVFLSHRLDEIKANQETLIEAISGSSDSEISETGEVVEYTAWEQEVINQLNGVNTCLFVIILCFVFVGITRFLKIFF